MLCGRVERRSRKLIGVRTRMNQVPSSNSFNKTIAPKGERRVIRALIQCLDRRAIDYCHWKSNCRLEDTLAGDEDIDVLVRRQQATAFQQAIAECGYKLALSSTGAEHPSTFHALALDAESGELVDLHVCHQVYSGDSLVKNYRMALEEPLLTQTRKLHGIKVPVAELELLYFVLRIALKHLSVIEVLKSNRKYYKTSDELVWLRSQASSQAAAELCQKLFPAIGHSLFFQLIAAIENPGALARRVVLGWKVRWRLRGTRRLLSPVETASRLWRFMLFIKSRLTRQKGMHLQAGGLIVALVGPKATGKSTLANELARRLGKHLKVVRVHAGKPPSSLLSWLPNLLVPLARKMFPHERLSEYEAPERRARRDYSLFYVTRMTLLAYDRRRLLRRALRQAAAGAIVISDRFPTKMTGAIDSSCFDGAAIDNCKNGLKRWLMGWERKLYSEMPAPDIVLKLEAPIDTALARDASRNKQSGPNADAVRRRWDLESSPDFQDCSVVRIDTTEALAESGRKAALAVWAAL